MAELADLISQLKTIEQSPGDLWERKIAAGARERIERLERQADVYANERDMARARLDRVTAILFAIYKLLPPGDVEANGKTYHFIGLDNPLWMDAYRALGERIRAIPDEIEKANRPIAGTACRNDALSRHPIVRAWRAGYSTAEECIAELERELAERDSRLAKNMAYSVDLLVSQQHIRTLEAMLGDLRRVLGQDVAGLPAAEALRAAAIAINAIGGGPLVDRLQTLADAIETTLMEQE